MSAISSPGVGSSRSPKAAGRRAWAARTVAVCTRRRSWRLELDARAVLRDAQGGSLRDHRAGRHGGGVSRAPRQPPRRRPGSMTKRSRILGFGSSGLLVIAGGMCAAVIGGGTGQVLALVLIGIGLVEATSLVFLEVGLSEDRDRARERKRRPPGRSDR